MDTETLPPTFDPAAVEAYLTERVSPANARASMRVIDRLIHGLGVTHKNKPGESFLLGHCVAPHDDLDALRLQAAAFLPYRKSDPDCKDASHGSGRSTTPCKSSLSTKGTSWGCRRRPWSPRSAR